MYTVEQVRGYANKILWGANLIAKFTPTDMDDKFLAVLTVLVTSDDAVQLVVDFLNSKNHDTNQPEKVVGAFLEHFGG